MRFETRISWSDPMAKFTEELFARESVWIHRIRQRIAFERIIATVGKSGEQARAKQFLEAMEQAHPELLEDIEQYTLDFFREIDYHPPELFDESEYSKAMGRKTALKLPKDIRWEERNIRRAVREYRDLFHPCEVFFNNAMKGLQYMHKLLPELFAKARAQAIEQRNQVLTFEIYCQCNCTTTINSRPADAFKSTDQGRFEAVSKRITAARQALEDTEDSRQGHWQFFLDRIREITPEMLRD
jgi:hypothetical protein